MERPAFRGNIGLDIYSAGKIIQKDTDLAPLGMAEKTLPSISSHRSAEMNSHWFARGSRKP
jgi:hypothetical protein